MRFVKIGGQAGGKRHETGKIAVGRSYTCSGHPVGAAPAIACVAGPGQAQTKAYEAGAMVRVSCPNTILSPLVITKADVTTILTALDTGFAAP